jgi:hypothetical protein
MWTDYFGSALRPAAYRKFSKLLRISSLCRPLKVNPRWGFGKILSNGAYSCVNWRRYFLQAFSNFRVIASRSMRQSSEL